MKSSSTFPADFARSRFGFGVAFFSLLAGFVDAGTFRGMFEPV
jgi:uncharacterized membrane protein YoaK (UPF0700 family)